MKTPITLARAGKPGPKTVVVLGIPRGGTSMVAQILHELGVFMGDEFTKSGSDYENFEDEDFHNILWNGFTKLIECVTQGKNEPQQADFTDPMHLLRKLIDTRNTAHAHTPWGWKHAAGSILWFLKTDLMMHLRNPHFITIWRDPVAVWQSEANLPVRDENGKEKNKWSDQDIVALNTSSELDPCKSLQYGFQQYQWLMDVVQNIQRQNYPHLVISYERCIRSSVLEKHQFMTCIETFLGLNVDIEHRAAAMCAINPR